MPEVNPQCFHLSASSIQAFKACPQRFRLAYREGLRTDRDTDSQRAGTNWHAMHETYANVFNEAWGHEGGLLGPECAEIALKAVVALLNQRYNDIPSWADALAWALEREVLYRSFVGYLWYWQNDPVEFLASEVPFDLPLHEPRTGMPLSLKSVKRVGKIDHLVKWHGGVCALERKSTSRGIAPDSDYWEKSKKDTQVSMYALAFDDMRRNGILGTGGLPFVLAPDTERFGNTLYDVWHKPTIKPAWLTQAETKAFIDSGTYCAEPFDVLPYQTPADGDRASQQWVEVDGRSAELDLGKKGFSIRETVGMFGARLLQDIYERPDFYFVRREIARTEAEIRDFRGELFAVYQAQQAFSRNGYWFSNESQCRATFPCPFIPICYGPGAASVCDGRTTPAGFKRIFVDLTVNGQEVEQ